MLSIIDEIIYYEGRALGRITTSDRALLEQFKRSLEEPQKYHSSGAYELACLKDGVHWDQLPPN